MFPVSDFNFVVAGIATFAATVGYACSRRLSTSLSEPNAAVLRQALMNEQESLSAQKATTQPSADDILLDEEPAPVYTPVNSGTEIHRRSPPPTTSLLIRRDSLKRKVPHDGFDEPSKEELGYPHNLANIYPNKRSRTPTQSVSTSQNVTPAASLDSIISQTTDVDVDIPLVSEDPQPLVETPAPEPPRSPSPVPEQATPREPSPTPVLSPASPPPPAVSAPQPEYPRPATPPAESPVPPPTTPKPATPKPSSTPSGFAAFAGSSSPFAALSKPKPRGFKSSGSIWSSTADLTTHKNEDAETSNTFSDIFNPLAVRTAPDDKEEGNHAIKEAKATAAHPTEKYTHITGEEEEEVELEQKGVKLYVKRGDRPFGDGMLGHVKLLSKRTTGEERILFRRDPLWKVSMNVRVQPTVRCTYVPEENVVRLILKENVETPSSGSSEGETKLELVIYAIKPGRTCSKKDFKDFAETLVKCPQFKATTDIPLS
ncbi:hypothetical protein M413DRAFT_447085 [Hebeloma cylindrosporum]|uniref:RanBD1 domain-containing protein n=1 Tax=Hebeloma cylindrosporum TaxID=76867 RepID=A0A0C3BSI7_HEBCY|nr:hypothetical protein M413DRAFT_447085 [Hebeloma cylindrosporum h7]